jgi:alkaline phosphatase D
MPSVGDLATTRRPLPCTQDGIDFMSSPDFAAAADAVAARRKFLKSFIAMGGCFVATAVPVGRLSAAPLPSSGGQFSFPQGVASADPQPDAIVFWTRVVSAVPAADPVRLRLQVAPDADFREVVVDTAVTARGEQDFTTRVFVDGLAPDTRYFYRFVAPDGTTSRIGRSHTAPAPEAARDLRIAVFSCQHYSDGFFSAYRRLLLDEAENGPDRAVDVVLHLGDFIYEFPEVDLYNPDGSLVRAMNSDGTQRLVPPLPSSTPARVVTKAETVADFRHLYRVYLTDPDLQDARASYPFVHLWDDHELINDCWQGFVLRQSIHQRKVNANQAWFEYIPAALTQADPGPAGENPARDFTAVQVGEGSVRNLDDHYLVRDEDNLAAIGSLTITRCLRWGRYADLFLPDQRSYRGERGVDASLLTGSMAPYPLWPMHPHVVETLNAGRQANNGNPPKTINYEGRTLANPRAGSPTGSMLGSRQKAWLKNSMRSSKARWKVLCNTTPLLRFGLDVSFRDGEPEAGLLWTDSWDGYPVERRELMNFILDEGIANVVSLGGDRHAHFAGLVFDDYDASVPRAVIPEFVGAGTSAGSRAKTHALEIKHDPQLTPLFLSIKQSDKGEYQTTPTLNAWLLFGAGAAQALHEGADDRAARAAAKTSINPHLKYADTDSYGYMVVHFGADRVVSEFVTIPEPLVDTGRTGPRVIRRVRYSVDRWESGKGPNLVRDSVEGAPPICGIRDP